MIEKLRKDLKKLSNKKFTPKHFKTGKGEYGEGDVFLGITVPVSRTLAEKYKDLTYPEIEALLKSEVHEERLIGLLILVERYQSHEMEQRRVYDFYLRHAKLVNNWDLVDLSSGQIVGSFLLDKPRDILYKLAGSKNIWERRIAMVACYTFIKNKDFEDALKIAQFLLKDEQDLIQKAVGWMLREVGKRDEKSLVAFLKENKDLMSKTSLRYAVERFPEKVRKQYLAV